MSLPHLPSQGTQSESAGHSGYLGDLSSAQAAKLRQLRQVASKADPEVDSMHDGDLLRFLRQWKWSVPVAKAMIVNALKWRRSLNVDSLTEHTPAVKEYVERGIAYAHGTNIQGEPVVVLRVRLHKALERRMDDVSLAVIWFLENAIKDSAPQGATDEQIAEAKVTLVFDMAAFDISALDTEFLEFCFKLGTLYYPERVRDILVYRLPPLFAFIVQPIMDGFPREVTELVKFVDEESMAAYIERNQLSVELGGTDPFVPEFPKEDEERGSEQPSGGLFGMLGAALSLFAVAAGQPAQPSPPPSTDKVDLTNVFDEAGKLIDEAKEEDASPPKRRRKKK